MLLNGDELAALLFERKGKLCDHRICEDIRMCVIQNLIFKLLAFQYTRKRCGIGDCDAHTLAAGSIQFRRTHFTDDPAVVDKAVMRCKLCQLIEDVRNAGTQD